MNGKNIMNSVSLFNDSVAMTIKIIDANPSP